MKRLSKKGNSIWKIQHVIKNTVGCTIHDGIYVNVPCSQWTRKMPGNSEGCLPAFLLQITSEVLLCLSTW